MGTVRFGDDHFANLEGEDLLIGSRDSNLYIISISELAASSPVCLMSKATSTKSWPMMVASINGKRYILVIVNDYSRYTWVFFLHTKDEAPDMIINFITQIRWSLKAQVLKVRMPQKNEYYATSTPEVLDNSTTNTLDNEDTPSSSSIVVEENEVPQIVTSSEEPIANNASTLVSNENANEPIQ
ncbi:integrase, catalytic region, zinc finger, CCHC-type containing protein [Tanacetum coccineum]